MVVIVQVWPKDDYDSYAEAVASTPDFDGWPAGWIWPAEGIFVTILYAVYFSFLMQCVQSKTLKLPLSVRRKGVNVLNDLSVHEVKRLILGFGPCC